ncbi:MAG: ROK family protein [Planctomycetes bacterium]|nr:ROK family protein [Planctomycetota bacterium]
MGGEVTPALRPAAIGIEIGGTKLQSAIVAEDGAVLVRRADAVAPAGGAEAIRAALAGQLADLLATEHGTGGAIRAVGIGFGGPVDRARGVVATSFHVGGWADYPLAAWVADEVRAPLGAVPCLLENDSNAAALAEATVGAGQGARVVFYTNSGSGIGAGLVIAGRLYHGRSGGEMELGHLRLAADGGILEEVASGWAIDRRVREEIAGAPSGCIARLAAATDDPPSARLLPAALAAGDDTARDILAGAAAPYAHALAHVVQLVNPDVIVLGGGVATIGEAWRAAVAARLTPLVMEPFRPGPPVRLAALGADVVPVGAALAALVDCGQAPDGA